MADAVKAVRQDMQHEASDELAGRQRHGLEAARAFDSIVLVYSRQQFEAAWASIANQAPHRHRQANSGTCRGREPPHARHTFAVLPPETSPHKIDLSGYVPPSCSSDLGQPYTPAASTISSRTQCVWPDYLRTSRCTGCARRFAATSPMPVSRPRTSRRSAATSLWRWWYIAKRDIKAGAVRAMTKLVEHRAAKAAGTK